MPRISAHLGHPEKSLQVARSPDKVEGLSPYSTGAEMQQDCLGLERRVCQLRRTMSEKTPDAIEASCLESCCQVGIIAFHAKTAWGVKGGGRISS